MNKKGWTYKKFGDICQSDLGKTLNHSTDIGNLFPYLCAINILWDKVDLSTLKETRFEESEISRFTVKKGDLLICEGGDAGRAAIWQKDEPILYQNALHRVRFNEGYFARFYLYYLKHLKESGIIDNRYTKGVTIKHLVKSSLLAIPVPVPNIEFQQQIVSELDSLNEAIFMLQQQLKDLDTLAQSLFYDMFGDPISNPKAWPVKNLSEVGQIIAGSTPSTADESNWDGDVNWVTPAELGEQLYYGETVRKLTGKGAKGLTLMPVGTVLLSSRAPIGKLAITTVPMCCNQGFKNIICNNTTNNIFLYYFLFLTMEHVKALGRGATFKEVSKSAISTYKVILPPLSLQQTFSDRITAIEGSKASLKAQITEMQNLLASRMQYWFD